MHESMNRLYRAARSLRGAETPSEVARLLNESPQTIKNWESRGISKSGLLKAQAAIGCRAEWLQSDIGPMTTGPASLESLHSWDDSTPLDEDDVELPLFKEVEIAAGDGTAHQVEINGRKLRFSKATLRAAGVDLANAACATATGTSMERLILDGSTIGIDRGRTQVKDGKIYAIDHAGHLRVKYLYRLPGGGLRIRSENEAEYPDETYGQGWEREIRVLGWVFWWSRLERW